MVIGRHSIWIACAVAMLFVAQGAAAQTYPAGSGTLQTKEKVKVSKCGGGSDEDTLDLTIAADGSWSATGAAGTFTGNLVAADNKGLKWDMVFDGTSLNNYIAYLESVASSLCGVSVTVIDGEIQKFELKLGKDLMSAQAQLKSKALGTSSEGDGKGKHQLKAKGSFTPI